MSKQPKFHLPANLWAKLPKLAQEMFVAMQTHIEELEAHVRELEVRLGQNSQNSSRPPSADLQAFSVRGGQVPQLSTSVEHSQGIWAIIASGALKQRRTK
ncbi:MAG: hypothetical protein IIB15_07555 [Chloroflexi bacterium]|nr:hypothetical protein [Chloroflexota bacterium]